MMEASGHRDLGGCSGGEQKVKKTALSGSAD
jgi:hypothetical protein